MGLSFAVYAIFMAGHLFNVLVTSSRLLFRRNHSRLWWDDVFSAATAAMDGCLLIRLFIFAVNPKSSHHYSLELAAAFLAVSFSRTSLLMAPTRLENQIPPVNHRAWILASIITVTGVSHAVLLATLCTTNPACNDTVCACVPPKSLSVSTFIMEMFCNAMILHHTWLIVGKQRAAYWIYTSNIILLVRDIVVLAIFVTQAVEKPYIVIYLINSSVILASLVTNLSTAVVAVGHVRAGGKAPNMTHSIVFVRSSYMGVEIKTAEIDELDVDDLYFIRRDRMANVNHLAAHVHVHA